MSREANAKASEIFHKERIRLIRAEKTWMTNYGLRLVRRGHVSEGFKNLGGAIRLGIKEVSFRFRR